MKGEKEPPIGTVLFLLFFKDLFDYISERKCLSEAEARRFFLQILEAVQGCHQRGVFHRSVQGCHQREVFHRSVQGCHQRGVFHRSVQGCHQR